MGHTLKFKFLEFKNKHIIFDIAEIDQVISNDNLFEACIKGKQARLPFEKSKDKDHIKHPSFFVHYDVCDPVTPPTINSKNYFVCYIDKRT